FRRGLPNHRRDRGAGPGRTDAPRGRRTRGDRNGDDQGGRSGLGDRRLARIRPGLHIRLRGRLPQHRNGHRGLGDRQQCLLASREAAGTAMTRAAEAVSATADSPGAAPACTYGSAVVSPNAGTVTVGWVGDSRAYWLSGGPTASASTLLTSDDSWAEAMVQAG